MSQDEFNFGPEARDAGIEQVGENTPDHWVLAFHDAVSRLAATGEPFTAEDIRDLVGDPPNHPNAFSAQCMAAVRRGEMEWTGETTACQRTSSHARGLGLKIYRGKP